MATHPLRTSLGRALALLCLAASSFSQATAAVAPGPELARLIELGQSDNRVQEHLDYLVNKIGPRLTSSTNLQRACEWARHRFASFGLDARLERWGEFAVGFDRWGASGGMVEPERIDYVFGTPAWSAGTPGPVRGQARLEPKALADIDAAPEEWRGAWVVERARGERPEADVRRDIVARLGEIGIAGEVRDGNEPIRTSGNYRLTWEKLPVRPQIRLRRDQYQDLLARLTRGDAIALEFDVDSRFLPGPVPLHNVVADLVGSELPDEYVIVGGHIDSWDGATGTNDNGTGVATTLEAARLLTASGAKPRRTIRFMLWSGEEQGLLGSRAWLDAHPELHEQISACLVHDGGTNYVSGISGTDAILPDLRAVFAPVEVLDPRFPFEVRPADGLPRGIGSDHDAFLGKGIPGFFWRQAGDSKYDHYHHTQYDTFDGAVPEYQRHSALAIAIGALGIANLDHKLDRTGLIKPGSGGGRGRRRMGVSLNETAIESVMEESKAAAAGWKEGDVIVSIDGVAVTARDQISEEMRKGGPKKTIVLRRGAETFESVLDYTEEDRQRTPAPEAPGSSGESPAPSGGSQGSPAAPPKR